MENIKVFDFLRCILIFVVVCNFTFSSGITWTKFSYDSVSTGKACAQSEILFQVEHVYQPLTCGMLCYLNDHCIHAMYQPGTVQCIGCRYRPNVALPPGHSDELQSSIHLANKDIKFDCKDILETNSSAASGVYEVANPMKVYCDMTTDGGGWTVIQNRFDGSVDFYRNFTEYENGFGDINGEYWLGLKNIQKIAEIPNEFWMEMVHTEDDRTSTEKYVDFKLLDGTEYTLSIHLPSRQFSGLVYFIIGSRRGAPFSTFDRDMDLDDNTNCAKENHEGFWYTTCKTPLLGNLNALYCTPETKCDSHSDDLPGHFYATARGPLRATRMMIRRVNHPDI